MGRTGFEVAWQHARTAVTSGQVSAELTPLARRLYDAALSRPVDQRGLFDAINDVLIFLSKSPGNTHANVRAISVFLDVDDAWDGHWQDVPEPLLQILYSMSSAMWQSVEDPEWTRLYGATPEQLIRKLRGVAV